MKKRVKVIKLIVEERMVSLRALEGAESVAAQAIGPPYTIQRVFGSLHDSD